ncbi:hypothetical protein AADG42_11980 [Ammonicoccus fulvus]|uniref:Uncharacterized protein n=1 Tax=Ammonicoccus fulvus TaxID=3138240 RepID=A0ABZ3FTF2_9ACTN
MLAQVRGPWDPALDAMWELPLGHRALERGLEDVDQWLTDAAPGRGRAGAIAAWVGGILALVVVQRGVEQRQVLPLLKGRGQATPLEPFPELYADLARRELVVHRYLRDWLARPTPASAHPLREWLGDYRRCLKAYLSAREDVLLPLVALRLSAAEWAGVRRAIARATPQAHRSLALGLVLRGSTPEQAASSLERLSGRERLFWYAIGRVRFRSTMDRLEGRGRGVRV